MVNTEHIPDNIIKIVQAMGFLLNFDDNHKIDRVKLMKLLWAADRMHLRRYGRTITRDDYYAMRLGPVPSLAYDISKLSNSKDDFSPEVYQYLNEHFMVDNYNTAMLKSPGRDHLSETDQSVLSEVWEKFGAKDSFELANNISHKYPEWAKFSNFFEEQHGNGRIHMDILEFFDNPSEDPYFSEPQDLLDTTKDLYEERQELYSTLVATPIF